MHSKAMFCLALLAVALFATTASANWADDFDGYATGSNLIGQGGWEGWGGGATTDAVVSGTFFRSAPNSVDILPTTDVIQQFAGYTTGLITISAWLYIPGNATGEQYFILCDAYDHAGVTTHWALQLKFLGGQVESEFDTVTYPIVYDQWAELKVEINMDTDIMQVYYDGFMFLAKSYTAGTNNDFTGSLNIACLDLFSNGGSDVYWDDITLEWLTTAVEATSWSEVKSLY